MTTQWKAKGMVRELYQWCVWIKLKIWGLLDSDFSFAVGLKFLVFVRIGWGSFIGHGLWEKLRKLLCAILPSINVRLPATRMSRVWGLPMDVAGCRVTYCEAWAKVWGISDGLSKAAPLKLPGWDGNRKSRVDIMGRHSFMHVGLVLMKIGLVFLLCWDGLKWCRKSLVLREVHERITLIVTSAGCVCYKKQREREREVCLREMATLIINRKFLEILNEMITLINCQLSPYV